MRRAHPGLDRAEGVVDSLSPHAHGPRVLVEAPLHGFEHGLVLANLSRSHPELRRVVAAGEYRRGCELVADMVVAAETPQSGDTRVLDLNGAIQLWLAEAKRYGPALIFATGSAEHVQQLQGLAEFKGLRLEKGGLYRGKRLVPCNSEKAVYAALALPFIPPELREGAGELEIARTGRLPKLVADGDIRGLLHCHTDFSDGGNTLEQMAEATRQRGYQYFGVADHSQSAGYAGGLKLDEVEAQHQEADALNASYGREFRIFKGIELDILQDGSLDYPEDVLDRFEFVVASVHSRFRLDKKAQTERILRAAANPPEKSRHPSIRFLARRRKSASTIQTAGIASSGMLLQIARRCTTHGSVDGQIGGKNQHDPQAVTHSGHSRPWRGG